MGSARRFSATEVTGAWDRLLWGDPSSLPPWQRPLRLPLRLLYALGRDIASGMLTLQATSLVYTTLLSLVPLLAVSFSVLKGLGVHNQLEPMLMQALHPLGAGAQEVAQQLISYVDNTNVRVLGAVGLAVLLYSVLSLISKIEQVFNLTWRIDRPRPIAERFSRYLSVLLVGPVLLFSALAVSASLRSNTLVQHLVAIEPLGFLMHTAEQLVPFLLITLAFTFVYSFVPNTRVRYGPAILGALVAGLLWVSAGELFADFMAGSTRYAAIYSSLAIPILFMMWVYFAWLIVLVGANIAFYLQYPEYLASRERDMRLSNRLRERVALDLMQRVVRDHFAGTEGATEDELAHAVGLPLANVRKAIQILQNAGFLVTTATSPPRLVPAQAAERLLVRDLLCLVRRFGEDPVVTPETDPDAAIAAIEQRLHEAMEQSLGDMSLKELALREER
ncbi:MAG: YihY family inner membrane protein [Thiohalocapsa sp.]|jgi:membrane protein|uniref:YhjD/YihY/BrkB family envelope integrity protein n=1 Tax=Thiohalocapsa sp. TaxID=2497641 RepID=UPI00260117F5|nr:YhjD/YihY/BrkB family envelope integrity protein [Thiohalocapsa sp.]MCG6940849.1 YihY family inner membrane protein [Thiohalocapsa sp.]